MTNQDIFEAIEEVYYDLTNGEVFTGINSLDNLIKELRKEFKDD